MVKQIDVDKSKLRQLEDYLDAHDNIVVTAHTRPDGDAVGSAIGLQMYLKNVGYKCEVVLPDRFPDFLKWIKGSKEIYLHEKDKKQAEQLVNDAGILFCVDYNQPKRAGGLEDAIKASDAKKVMIDHHPDPASKYFDLVFSYPEYSSTAEIIFHIIKLSGGEKYICEHAAAALYAGIMTDTGSFRHASTGKSTFEVAARLVDKGIDIQEIGHRVYDTYSESRLRLLGFSLSERLVVLSKYSTAYIYLSKDDMKRFKYRDGDTEGLVNYGLSIKGINLAVLFTEKKGEIRLSMRSKIVFSVNEFARKHFDGGGHDRAAGGNSKMSMKDTIDRFVSLLPTYEEQLNVL